MALTVALVAYADQYLTDMNSTVAEGFRLTAVGVADAAEHLTDMVSRVAEGSQEEASGSLLILGPPGVGQPSH